MITCTLEDINRRETDIPSDFFVFMDHFVCVCVCKREFLHAALQSIFLKKEKKKERKNLRTYIMSESVKRCVPPCSRLISEDDLHKFCFECLGDEHAALGLEGECEHCDVLPIKVLCVLSSRRSKPPLPR